MSGKKLKFDNIRVNKKEFHESKQPVNLDLINVDQIVVSDKFRHNDDSFKYVIVYKEGEIVKPLCIISDKQSLLNYSGKNHNILTYPFLFIIRRFKCYYTHCQETALN